MAPKAPDEPADQPPPEQAAECRECGASLHDAVRFCTFCGAPIDSAADAVDAPAASASVDSDADDAGAAPAPPPQSHDTAKRQKSRRWRRRRRVLGVLVFLAVVIGLGVVVVMATTDSGDSDNTVAGDGGNGAAGSTTTTSTLPPPAGPFKVTDGVNVRAGPGTTFPILGQIETGNDVLVVCAIDGEAVPGPSGVSTKWLRIQTPAIAGYVTAQYVDTGLALLSPAIIGVCSGV